MENKKKRMLSVFEKLTMLFIYSTMYTDVRKMWEITYNKKRDTHDIVMSDVYSIQSQHRFKVDSVFSFMLVLISKN